MRDEEMNREELLRELEKFKREREQWAVRRSLTLDVLHLVLAGVPNRKLMLEVVRLLAERLEFDAVGIRLKEGDDFPYCQAKGLSGQFITRENSLCPSGLRPNQRPGDFVELDCICGMVLQNRLDRSEPFCTAYGSFWSNNNSSLIETRPELLAFIRGECIRAGYESTVLVPLRFNGKPLGLLQFEDKRKDRFEPGLIQELEMFAMHLSLALAQRESAAENEEVKAELERRVQTKTDALRREIQERKRSERILAESEQRFRTLFENSPVAYQSLDRAGRFIDMNDKLCEMLGYARQELLGLSFAALWPAEERYLFPQQFESLVASGSIVTELALVRRDGEQITTLLEGQVQRDANGRFVRTHCILHNITERKQTEEALRESEERFRAIFQSSPDPMVLATYSDGRTLDVNQAYIDFFGFARSEIIGKTAVELGLWLDPTQRIELREQLATLGRISDCETRLKTRSDGERTTLLSASLLRIGSRRYMVVVVKDISERKRLEEALRRHRDELDKSRASLALAMSLAGLVHWEFDFSTDRILVDDQFYALFATTAEREGGYEIPAETYAAEFLPAEDARTVIDRVRELRNAAEHPVVHMQHRILRRDGETREVAMCAFALQDEGGRPTLCIGATQDITELKQNEQALIRAKRDAEEASLAKSAFLATMSHEIRTPLNGVMGMLQILRVSGVNAEQGGYIDTALTASRNLMRILGDILDLSRIEAGHLLIEVESFTLEEVVSPVIGALAGEAASKGLALSADIDPRIRGQFMGDAGRIRQILFNLVGNAIKYTESGSVLVQAYPLPNCPTPGRVSIHLSVADTGIGIADGKLRLIFEPFAQADQSYTRKHGGTGLGLAIVKRLVELIGGGLAISTEQGRGTELHVTLWLENSTAAVEPATLAATPVSPTGRSVLVVEDEAINRLAIVTFLQKAGYATGQAKNGREALEILARGRFDCVLMDVQMPIMNGVEATRRIRSGNIPGIDPLVPVIALTAYAMTGDREDFLAAGMDAYTSKPVDMDALRGIIDSLLAGSCDAAGYIA